MYRLFDAAVASAIPLEGVSETQRSEADINVVMALGAVDESGFDWFHDWRESRGERVLACARRTGGCGATVYLLRFPDLADFLVADNQISCYPQPGCPEHTLRHLLQDQVIPRLWAHRGHLVLHGSTVQLANGQVIVFLGESGWGKSTLAAALAVRGSVFLGDDSLVLRACDLGVKLLPNYSGPRLNSDSIAALGMSNHSMTAVSHYSGKARMVQATPEDTAVRLLHTLYIMQAPGATRTLSIHARAGASVIATVIKRSFLLDINDRRSAADQLHQVGSVIDRIPQVRSLAYPRDFRALPALCDALLDESSR